MSFMMDLYDKTRCAVYHSVKFCANHLVCVVGTGIGTVRDSQVIIESCNRAIL